MKGSSSSAGARRATAAILMLLISWAGAWAEDQVGYEKTETTGTVPSDDIRLNGFDHLGDGKISRWNETETNGTGYWEICGLPPGNYTVCEVDQVGWSQTHPVNESGSPICHTFTITNSNKSNLDFLNRGDLCISGHKYWDKNGNGMKDVLDSPVGNWTIQVRNESGWLVDETTTDENGYWEICNLVPETYNVSEVVEEGWKPTNPPSGYNGSVVLESDNITGIDFLNTRSSCISGHKYWDKDGNSMKDGLDSPLENWTIFVDLNNSGILDPGEPNVTTDADGHWQICNLFPGTYNVSEVMKEGWKPTNPTGGYNDSVVVVSDNKTGIDFLNTGLYCLYGRKYWDKNQNGTWERGEDNLSGWKIIVEDETKSNRWRTTTNGNGNWTICNLPPGTYLLSEGAPDGEIGWIASQRPGDNGSITITNHSWKGLDFGNYRIFRDEPDQYEQFCESQLVEGTGYVDVKTSVMDKKLAMDYQNQMFGEGDIGMESAQVYSQEPNKLIRPLPNCSDTEGTTLQKLNFFENTKLEYEGDMPLVGRRSISSIERYGGIGADVQETFSVRRLEADQTMFLGQTSNSTIRKTVGVNTLNSFNGTWGTQSSLHKIFYKDIRRRDLFSGEFELQRELKFHENPAIEPKICPCGGVDC